MADFPTLSVGAARSNFIRTKAYDPTLRSEFKSGAHLTRAQYTSAKSKWEFDLRNLSDADVSLLEAFQETVSYGGNAFDWTPDAPSGASEVSVKFMDVLSFTNEEEESDLWRCHITLVEA